MHRLLITAVAVSSLAFAQQSPSAAELFTAYVKASGGAEKLLATTTRVVTGTMENSDDGTTSKIEIAAKAPTFYSMISTSPENEVTRVVFTGKEGWFSDPDAGVRPMSAAELVVFAAEYDFQRTARLGELYPTKANPRSSMLRDKPVWLVDVKTPSGEPEKLYFDAATGLLVSREFQRMNLEDGIISYQEFYEDYRDVDGIAMPHLVRRATPDYELTFRFSSIRHNAPIDDSTFAKPSK